MDRLTELFSPSCWVPGKSRDAVMDGFFAGIRIAYEELKNDETLERLEDVAYGAEEAQKVDVWGKVDEKLVIFVHGGYWAAGTRKDCVTPAKCALRNGFSFASVGYRLAIHGCTLTDSVDDVVRGVDFILNSYPCATKVVIGGHSAGAHLAVHESSFPIKLKSISSVTRLRNPRIQGMLLYSGCYFLEELVATEIGTDIKLTDDQAKLNTCDLALLNGLNLKASVILGLLEAPKLVEQNRRFARERGEAELSIILSSSHYTIMTNMLDATSSESLAVSAFLQKF